MPEIERLFFADSDLAIQVISQKSNLNESEMHTLCAWILAQTVLDLVSKDEINKHVKEVLGVEDENIEEKTNYFSEIGNRPGKNIIGVVFTDEV